VYFLKGSPLSLFDLEKANFRHASTIFVCHVGAPHSQLMEPWMVDSEVVCCVRLIESELPPATNISVITELAVDTNHPFVPLGNKQPAKESKERSSSKERSPSKERSHSKESSDHHEEKTRKSEAPAAGRKSRFSMFRPSGRASVKPAYCNTCGNHYSLADADATSCKICGTPREAQAAIEVQSKKAGKLIDEYYRQPRYACGQLFVGNIITSLTVNTFYNPSLWELVHQMIKADVIIVPVSKDWEGKSYYEFFTQKLLQEDDLMGVAIYRRNQAGKKRKKGEAPEKQWSYVMTGPAAKETHMMKGDRVICFSSAFKIKEEDLEIIEEAEAITAVDKQETEEEDDGPAPLNPAWEEKRRRRQSGRMNW
jgi:hypothetical protein